MNGLKAFLLVSVIFLTVCGLALAGDVPEPTVANLNNDDSADFADFALMASNWQQTGIDLAGDLDDSNTVDIDDLTIFGWFWLTQYSQYQQCQPVDLDIDGIIAFEDMAKFAQNWLLTGAGLIGDFDTSNLVDCNDLSIFADCWLKGSRPESIWEQFKSALASSDIDTALTFVAESSQATYSEIFQAIGSNLPNFAAGMGTLTLESQDEDRAVYEMTHQDGLTTYSFPVVFIKDEDGSWKILNF